MYNIADLDIDCKSREDIVNNMRNIPASKISKTGIFPHGVGVYFCDIPLDVMSGLASIDYKRAEEEYGFVKIDVLHNSVYDRFQTRTELMQTINKPIIWELLQNESVVVNLPHIGSYYNLMKEMPIIDSIEKLAYFIAVIRPGKKHLIDVVKETNNWESISQEIWIKPTDGSYYYKKSHAISYAIMISILLH
jgi:hypothetical protein